MFVRDLLLLLAVRVPARNVDYTVKVRCNVPVVNPSLDECRSRVRLDDDDEDDDTTSRDKDDRCWTTTTKSQVVTYDVILLRRSDG